MPRPTGAASAPGAPRTASRAAVGARALLPQQQPVERRDLTRGTPRTIGCYTGRQRGNRKARRSLGSRAFRPLRPWGVTALPEPVPRRLVQCFGTALSTVGVKV